MPTGTEKLAASTKDMIATVDSILKSIERIAQFASIQRAVRDRAAFDRAWADRAERERRQIADTQAKAAAFYGRAGK